MDKATEKALGGLHARLAEVLKDSLQDKFDTETGEKLPPNAAILNVARQFLKDNKIEAVPAQGTPLHGLSDLPVFDEEDGFRIAAATRQ